MSKTIRLDGASLRVGDIAAIVSDPSVRVAAAPSALARVKAARAYVEKEMERTVVYGVNTGLGPMADHLIAPADLMALQRNLIRSHASGAGPALPEAYVLAAMVVRANTLLKGYSGATPALIARLLSYIDHRIIPVVPRHGAVGTSGDLVQLAHIALAVAGEGEVFFKGKRQETRAALRALKLPPTYALAAKEGLALINGTSMMSGIAALLVLDAKRALSQELALSALALELAGARDDMLSPILHGVRPHRGQKEVAATLFSLVKGSKRIISRSASLKGVSLSEKTHVIEKSVQEIYSLRCTPQILGPIHDALEGVQQTIETEINSATDNPIVDASGKHFLHGGNFHGEYIAEAADRLKEAMVKMTMLSERRINFFLHSKINGMFPPFLNLHTPGLTLALQGLQFVATSTTAHSQSLGYPHRLHSIPTNADNQDVVSMGCDAALIAAEVLDNAWIVLSIEALTLAQALECLAQKEGKKPAATLASFSKPSQDVFVRLRKVSPPVIEDRALTADVAAISALLRSR